MTREDILRELGWPQYIGVVSDLADRIERVVRLAEAAEREACALMVERGMGDWRLGKKVAAAIRARGESSLQIQQQKDDLQG